MPTIRQSSGIDMSQYTPVERRESAMPAMPTPGFEMLQRPAFYNSAMPLTSSADPSQLPRTSAVPTSRLARPGVPQQ